MHQARQQLAREAPRPEKAGRLYRHALALTPRQPDLLNEYGEFLERYARDVRAADHHYCRALAARPSHAAALFNRQRARPLVAAAEQRDWAHLSAKRDALGRVPDSHRGLRRMKRDDYVRHLQETAALEGNTFTLAETRALLETRMAIGGRSLAEHNEILGLEAALSFINESLSSRRRPWAVDDVLDIHRRVLGHVDPLGAGRLRLTQVYVGSHVPPPAARLPELLDEFIAWLNSGRAATLAARHPVELAARAHYRLVHIHPFYDGNGRTARLLMNYILMQAGYPPVSVRMADRQHYYRHLEAANGGDVRPFVRFIARCTDRTLDEYLSAVSDDPAVAAVLAASQPIDGDTIVVGGPPTELQRPPTPAAADWDSQDSDGDDAMEAEP